MTESALAGRDETGDDTVGGSIEAAAGPQEAFVFGRGLLYVVVYALQLASATVVSPILVHLLSPTDFGRLSAAIALNPVLVLLAGLGLDQAISLVHAEPDGERRTRGLVAQGAVLAFVVAAGAWLTASWWSPALGLDGATDLLKLVAAWTLPTGFVTLALITLVAQDRLLAYSVVCIVVTVGAQVGGLLTLLLAPTPTATLYAQGYLVVISAAAVLAAVLVRPRWRSLTDRTLSRHAFGLGVPLMLGSFAVYVMNSGDRLVLARLEGAVPVGRYQIAYTIGSVLMLLLTAASTLWAPRLSAIADLDQRWRAIADTRDGLLRLLAPAFAGLLLASPLLLRVVAPARLHVENLLLVVFLVAVTAVPLVFQNAASRAQVTLRQTRTVATLATVGAVLNIVLNFAFIPFWGLEGSAAATTAAFTVQAVLQYVTLPRGTLSARVAPSVVVAMVVVVAGGLAYALWWPHGTSWQIAGFVGAVACLPWLLREARFLRVSPA